MNHDLFRRLSLNAVVLVICFLLLSLGCNSRSLHTSSHTQRKIHPTTELPNVATSTVKDEYTDARDLGSLDHDLGNPETDVNFFQNEELVNEEDSFVKKLPFMTPAQEHWETRRLAEVVTTEAGLKDIFFEFDSWRLTKEAKRILASNAEWLKTHPDDELTIEGHCDERGTHAYNYALGEKRARMARNFLVALGVSPSQMGIVSYGKDNPNCTSLTEACFEQNRRAHLVLGINVVANVPKEY